MKRVASHQLDEEGFISCQPNSTCKFYSGIVTHLRKTDLNLKKIDIDFNFS